MRSRVADFPNLDGQGLAPGSLAPGADAQICKGFESLPLHNLVFLSLLAVQNIGM